MLLIVEFYEVPRSLNPQPNNIYVNGLVELGRVPVSNYGKHRLLIRKLHLSHFLNHLQRQRLRNDRSFHPQRNLRDACHRRSTVDLQR